MSTGSHSVFWPLCRYRLLLMLSRTESPCAPFLVCTGMLIAVGTLMVYSASITARPTEAEQIYLSRHLVFLGCAILAGSIAAHMPAAFWERTAGLWFVVTIALLVAVLIPGIGSRVNGAQRWIRLGPVSIQPSETAKLTLTLILAKLLSRREGLPLGAFELRLQVLVPIAMTTLLVLIEPDMGTTVFLLLTCALVLYFAGWPGREFVVAAGVTIPALGLLLLLRPYQWRRIEGFVTAWVEPESAPYQVRQSLTTLGVGGGWGAGLGSGWQKLSFLPEANTDFVFAVIGEELGLVGTLGVVVLWCGFLLTGLMLLQRAAHRRFEFIVGSTLLAQLVMQALINVGVVTAMLPPKGISHPFISYGGSSLLVSCLAVGIIVSLSQGVVDRDNQTPESEASGVNGVERAASARKTRVTSVSANSRA